MGTEDRRRHVRIETNNLISHESISEKGQIVSRSMGKALNVSRSGILLETPDFIAAEHVLLSTVDLDDNLIEIKGNAVYCRGTDYGMYQVGISFIGSEEENANFVVRLIKLYHHRKHNLLMRIAA